MINGFWSNEGMNDDKGTRQQAIDDLESSFKNAVAAIMANTGFQKSDGEAEIDKQNPFFAAMKDVPKLEEPTKPELKSVETVVEEQQQEFDRYIDQ